ncbi:NAD-dependent epimerase/dehydratase family protein [Leucobacter viscericola]|uniref:UDP-glucose 4-epimerase n=1 Tax=Leucobacter viscericola TaxID=2714935 RepID=A0A6G7XFE9_9MICO|nr:NAD-dependent epimerase/dehydratase family protein [Leucobacter viscericola]QIK63169.1 NAD-dependent epimerase/dehydratase family protein [Leucobacter viscericola]
MSRDSAPKLLVTGGLGFIGTVTVRQALSAGWSVRVLDSLRTDVHACEPDTVSEFERSGVEVLIGDVRDSEAVAASLDGVDAVCHLAAKVGLGVDIGDAPDYVASNSLGTAVLLSAMRDRAITRLCLASSMVVYGEGLYDDGGSLVQPPQRRADDLEAGQFEPRSERTGIPLPPVLITEDQPCDPRNTYAATKLEQELLAREWARSTGGHAALLRYHNVYGPGMPQGTPYAGVASLFRSALERGEAPRVFEDGKQRRDFIHVADIASANLAALNWCRTSIPGTVRAFNIGSGTVRSIGEFATALAAAMSGPAPRITGEYRLGDVRHITAASDRARNELGWMPRIPFQGGVAQFARETMRKRVSDR